MKYPFLIIASIFLMMSGGCNKSLELDLKKKSPRDYPFSTPELAEKEVAKLYDRVRSKETLSGLALILDELMADNVHYSGESPSILDVYSHKVSPENPSLLLMWNATYRMILSSNSIIKRVHKVEGMSEVRKQQIRTEARFIRALAFLRLTNLFGASCDLSEDDKLTVPLMLDSAGLVSKITYPQRATAKEMFDFLETELKQVIATGAAGDQSLSGARFKPTSMAGSVLLSRLYLYRKDWKKADRNASRMIADQSVFGLSKDYSFYKTSNLSKEVIFSIGSKQNSVFTKGKIGSFSRFFLPVNNGGNEMCSVSSILMDSLVKEPKDKRLKELTIKSKNRFWTLKYNSELDQEEEIPMIRVSEAYLNKAEAMAELKWPNAGALALVNKLRERADLPMKSLEDFYVKDEDKDKEKEKGRQKFMLWLLQERRKELSFEGHRRLDLLRRQKDLKSGYSDDRVNLENAKYGAPGAILPIPAQIIKENTSVRLLQNPGY